MIFTNFSFILLIKWLFIIVYIIINIYFLITHMENKKVKLEYKQSGLFDGSIGKRFLQLGTIAGTLATGYGTAIAHISYKDSLKTSEELKKISTLAEETKEEISKISKTNNLYQKLQNNINDVLSKISEVKQKHKTANEDLNNVTELINKLNNLPEDSNERNIIINLLNSAQDKAKNSFSDVRISVDILKNTSLDYNRELETDIKESFIGGEFLT